MNKTLTKVALRYRAIYLDVNREEINMNSEATAPVMAFVARLKENGFSVSEELLHVLNSVSADVLVEITETINEVMGVDLNWAPLVKGWDVPTGESHIGHLITWMVNLFGGKETGMRGTTMPCGHFIPEGIFPIERYNGCPLCGTPFKTADFVYKGQGSKLRSSASSPTRICRIYFPHSSPLPLRLTAHRRTPLRCSYSIIRCQLRRRFI